MKIVLDLQSIQTASKLQDIGRDSLLLALAIARNTGNHEIWLVLNSAFPNSILDIRQTFDGLIPQSRIRVFDVPFSTTEYHRNNEKQVRIAELIREYFLQQINPDIVLVTSLFEGFADDAVTSISIYADIRSAVVLHDPIPLIHETACLQDEGYRKFHLSKVESLKKADLYLAVSENSKNKAIEILGIAREKIWVIPNDLDKHFVSTVAKNIQAIEKYKKVHIHTKMKKKPKLAYFSPLPPIKSGISGYSVELLPYLEKYYDITLIVDQKAVAKSSPGSNFPIYSDVWFLSHIQDFDRIIYQFGNSPYHSYMRPILEQYSGVVVMHDFFISWMLFHEEIVEKRQGEWINALYHSHGYGAVKEYFYNKNIEVCRIKYPSNLELIENAKGIITHSNYAKKLADIYYDSDIFIPWSTIPLLRIPAPALSKKEARKSLGLSLDDFIVCSFGFLVPAKLNDRLLNAWNLSKLSRQEHCKLIFVGEKYSGEYGDKLLAEIERSSLSQNIKITGWVASEVYKLYLEAADIGVQLRTQSLGETSAAVLDCMNYGLATVVNANGSLAELPDTSVHKLSDDFEDFELVEALEKIYKNKKYRTKLGKKAKKTIQTKHSPGECARQYMESIESSYMGEETTISTLITKISKIEKFPNNDSDILQIAQAIKNATIPNIKQKQLLVDVSTIVRTDLKTGIERVVRAQLLELIKSPPQGFRVEPVYLSNSNGWHYSYARKYTCRTLGLDISLEDKPVEIMAGDIFYGLDFYSYGVVEAAKSGLYLKWKIHGVQINFTVYDLLPISSPEFFPEYSREIHFKWLTTICQISDHLICISNTVANELKSWITINLDGIQERLKITVVPLGADIEASLPSAGLPQTAEDTLAKLKEKYVFLMVGTIEPRKGYLQVLEAFEELWKKNMDICLVIVGREGWTALPNQERRTIPQIVDKLQNHPEKNRRLFWLKEISDEYLREIYSASTCLIAASENEGFGLPLIEAAQHGLPIIARDIAVFREVALDNAFYFPGNTEPLVLADAITVWLEAYQNNSHILSEAIPYIIWKENARQVVNTFLNANGK